ncbi:hypothetical protein U9M48_018252 [Paspalum notatum var. saurae]|uniref:Uncharacterized protein n=1 Tax=Paspalum notatum var. saurae TaxID=547442 RepID=A0AAQ3WPY9_PASNO
MLNAMSALLSSLARRLAVPLRRRKSITSSAFVVARRRPFFPCGCGAGLRDVSDSPLVVVKRGTRMMRKVKARRIRERKRGKGGDLFHDGDGGEPCVWRRAILLGRRCQPLEFTGAIHYDCDGQRLWRPRTPPLSSPLLSPVHPSELGYMDRA